MHLLERKKAEEIIANITIPEQLGRLTIPSDQALNGPSGIALDKLFLERLGLERRDAWLCDLLPESRVNPLQRKAIEKHYNAEAAKFNLPSATIPDLDEDELGRQEGTRREELLEELETSEAKTLVLLGDLPIRWFLQYYDKRYSTLSDFGERYGSSRKIMINKRNYSVIPLCHPRNAARLGMYSKKWAERHDRWKPDKI